MSIRQPAGLGAPRTCLSPSGVGELRMEATWGSVRIHSRVRCRCCNRCAVLKKIPVGSLLAGTAADECYPDHSAASNAQNYILLCAVKDATESRQN